MKHYLLLPIAATFMVSPALAQYGGETNSSNLETQEDVIRGAEESEMPGAPDLYEGELRTGRSATYGGVGDSGTNSGNLVTHDEVWRGAAESSGQNILEDAGDDFETAID